MTETIEYCIRGCVRRRRHVSDCDDQDCRGCEPRLAKHGRLCWPCHRRFELMLSQVEITERWLTGNLPAGLKAARSRNDAEQRTARKDPPAPLNVAILDVREQLADQLSEWVDDLCSHVGLRGPDEHSAVTDAAYLVTWLSTVERLEWVGDWFEELAETMSEAHSLAPWRPEVKRLPQIACPECHCVALVIFGGEDTVVCQECRGTFDATRYEIWTRIIEEAS